VIVESTSAQRGRVEGEAERSDEMEPGTHVRAQPDDVSGVHRYLRCYQHDLEHQRRSSAVIGTSRVAVIDESRPWRSS